MSTVRFLHTADWQLGMTRRFLAGEAQARFAQARLDVVRALGSLASRAGCEFVLVCGDVFESSFVDRRVVGRALEALAGFDVPVYLLPGNHDPLDASSVWSSRAVTDHLPPHVRVLDGSGPVTTPSGAEIVAAPWRSKRPTHDLVAAACAGLSPAPAARTRILAGHGAVDVLAPGGASSPGSISLAAVEQALGDGRIHYLALGDRHSATEVGATGRVWYSGAPEATDFDEVRPGRALVVDVSPDEVAVNEHEVGRWRFLRREVRVDGAADVDQLEQWMGELAAKEVTVLRLTLVGTLTLRDHARLEAVLERAADLFAAVETGGPGHDLVVLPDHLDLDELGLSGFAAAAVAELRTAAGGDHPASVTARDALALLYRLAGGPV